MGQHSLACVRECSALLGLALALAIDAGDGILFSYRRMGSGGRLLPWAISPLRTLRDEFKRGRPAVAPAISDSRRGIGDFRRGESVISGVEGRRLFSPRSGTDSRARNGGGCAVIGAGFTVALRSCGNSSMERATTASVIDVESATAATLRPDAALCFASSVPVGCSSAGFFPTAYVGCFTVERPSPAVAAGEGCSSAAGYFTTGGGCSSPTATGSSTAA
ncbi:hypothetical protein B296_00045056 [Ensete ventricosum]|uniref:Uncharacterized protein n=1 Tax=Ensete ventricosum TaxID=4639 RepID=A0A426XC04_ENSVE|nr:hypothetical protein B296_00045056 [Ensete ventricosum]